jgi:hypothetical protein
MPVGVILSAMPALQLKQKRHGGGAIAEHDRIRKSRDRGPDDTSADSKPLSLSRPMTACLTAQLSRFAEALGEQKPRQGF